MAKIVVSVLITLSVMRKLQPIPFLQKHFRLVLLRFRRWRYRRVLRRPLAFNFVANRHEAVVYGEHFRI